MKSNDRYTPTAIVLHWLVALGLAATFCVGVYMVDLERTPTKIQIYDWHRSLGVTLLALALLRLLWRLTHRPPPDLPMPAWQAKAAHALHGLMYVLMLAVPLAGWAMNSAKGKPTTWFGLLSLPGWVPADKALEHLLEALHSNLSWALAALVALHVAAAFKHHVVDTDGLLDRMRLGQPSRQP